MGTYTIAKILLMCGLRHGFIIITHVSVATHNMTNTYVCMYINTVMHTLHMYCNVFQNMIYLCSLCNWFMVSSAYIVMLNHKGES